MILLAFCLSNEYDLYVHPRSRGEINSTSVCLDLDMIYVPDHLVPGFKGIAELKDDERAVLVQVFGNADVRDDAESLHQKVGEALRDLSKEGVDQITTSLLGVLGLSELMDDEDLPKEVSSSLAARFAWASDSKDILARFLIDLVRSSSNLRLRTKAQRLARERERLLVDVRLIVDVRPVFDLGDDVAEPNKYVAIYTLRFDYVDETAGERGAKSMHFAVDDEDLERLEATIKRAREKISVIDSRLANQGWEKLDS